MVIKAHNMLMLFFQQLTIWKDQEHMVKYNLIFLVNTEGRVQMGNEIVLPAGHAREQW